MKTTFPESDSSARALRWPARLGHELLCAAITAIFGVLEFLVLVTEFFSTKLFARRATAKESGDSGS